MWKDTRTDFTFDSKFESGNLMTAHYDQRLLLKVRRSNKTLFDSIPLFF